MKLEPVIYQFEKSHASVIFKNEFWKATGKKHASLEVMAIDAYGFQREFSLRLTFEPGNSKNIYWESQIYQHPGRRFIISHLGNKKCEAFIKKFLAYCKNYPLAFFNEKGVAEQNYGFVKFAERLHRGEEPSVKLL
jgi:hypothetical protein